MGSANGHLINAPRWKLVALMLYFSIIILIPIALVVIFR